MATVVIMPRQGQSVESCVITSWAKKVGDPVHTGETLFSYETDKAAFDEEAKVDGTLLAVFYQEQDDVPCLSEVAVIGAPGEDVSGFGPQANGSPTVPELVPEITPVAAAVPVIQTAVPTAATGISPRARVAAERLHVDLTGVTPTGPHGRILERDVLSAGRSTSAAIAAGSTAGMPGTGIGGRVTLADQQTPAAVSAAPETAPVLGYHDEKISHMRKIIADSMHNSLATMAQLTHHSSFDASSIIAYRKELKAAESLELPGITYNDLILYAVSRVLKRHPVLNAHWMDDKIRYFDHVHLGMAVDTPRGLLVPTIFNADTKSLAEIAKETKELAATFTVSNLGTLDIEMFTPVINPPQTGILGVDCMVDRVRMADGNISVYPAMGLSLTYDHRAMDGAPASRFLKELKTVLEHFSALLAE